ncbi:MAG: FAD:protein FMN transferase [candidate division WOR-3 bacterium]|nr:MAG: FAD:protein FMN transferase [candidate division WOR-3 bacterium]
MCASCNTHTAHKGTVRLLKVCLVLLCQLFVNCRQNTEYVYRDFLVGATCEVKYYLDNASTAADITQEIHAELVRLDSLLNRFSDISLVSELNHAGRAQVPEDIRYLFLLSDSVSRLTDGLFDISVAPLIEFWGFYDHEFANPDTAKIQEMLKLVDHREIRFQKDTVILATGMKIDFGGIAQGYAADRLAGILRGYHVTSALINIGGEIVAIGKSPEARSWRIGIKNPRGEGLIETVEIETRALSTSGDYEKFFVVGGIKYPHIINPNTGFPAREFASVTVFHDRAAVADAIATAVCIMGPVKGAKFLDSLGIRGIIYYEENGVLQRMETP